MKSLFVLAALVGFATAQGALVGDRSPRQLAKCAKTVSGYVDSQLEILKIDANRRSAMTSLVRRLVESPSEQLRLFERGKQLVLVVTDLTEAPGIPEDQAISETFKVVHGHSAADFSHIDRQIAAEEKVISRGRIPLWVRAFDRLCFGVCALSPLVIEELPAFSEAHWIVMGVGSIPLLAEALRRGMAYYFYALPHYRTIAALNQQKREIARELPERVKAMTDTLSTSQEPAVVVTERFSQEYLAGFLKKLGFHEPRL